MRYVLAIVLLLSACSDPLGDQQERSVSVEAQPGCGAEGEACCPLYQCAEEHLHCVSDFKAYPAVYQCLPLPQNPGRCGEFLEACCGDDPLHDPQSCRIGECFDKPEGLVCL